jgi:hypothetical protein
VPRRARAVAAAFALLAGVGAAVPAAATGAWRWPVHGDVAGPFRLRPAAPFASGQRRGIDIAGPPGARVRAACPGRVTFAGALPRRGLGVSVVCGRLVATHLGLGTLAVRRGDRVRAGTMLGRLAGAGVLRLGARVRGDRFGYVDPLGLLAGDPVSGDPPALGPAPRGARPTGRTMPRRDDPARLRPAPREWEAPVAHGGATVGPAAWLGLAAVAAAAGAGTGRHRRRRRDARDPLTVPLLTGSPVRRGAR